MSRLLTVDRLAADFPLYAKTCLKILDKQRRLSPFELNQGQWKVEEAIEHARRRGRPALVVELKARQVGFSTDAEARLFHLCHLRENREAVVVAHRIESATNVFRMSRRFYDNLPDGIRPETKHLTKKNIGFGNGSNLRIEVAKDEGGRSFTADAIHLSEFAFYPNPDLVLKAIMQAVAENPHTLVIVESTPKGMNEFYDMYVQAKRGDNDFTAIFHPWFEDPGYVMEPWFGWDDLDDDEKKLAELHELSLERLAWRRWCIRNKCKNDLETFIVEYPSDDQSCFLASGRRIFERKAIQYYASFVPPNVPASTLPKPQEIGWNEDRKEPILTIDTENGRFRVYNPPNRRHTYIAGADPSEGDPGSDPSPIVVLNQMTFDVDAVWYGRMRPDRLARIMRSVCVYYLGALAVWEQNNHGLSFQIALEPIYDNIYLREVFADSVLKRVGDKAGYLSTVKSRHTLFNAARTYVNEMMGRLNDPDLTSQLSDIFYDDNDRPQHENNKNDDLVVALGLCLEAHRDDPKAELVPLTEDDQTIAIAELRRAEVARSMGIPYDLGQVYDRFNVTAAQLEEIDEWRARREKHRQRAMGPLPT